MNNDIINHLLENRTEARELLRSSLKTYIKVFHFYLFRQDFIFKDFHIALIEKLEKLVFDTKNTKHLCINISPRVGKSQLIKYFISWVLAVEKKENFIYTSYSEKLVTNFSTEIRDLIASDLYKKLFNINLQKDTTSKELWKVEKGGQLLATPIQGGITGFGSSFTIIDDPMNSVDFRSETIKSKINEIYSNTLKSRFNDKRTGRFILIMQRLAKDDLTGYLLENEKDNWDFVSLPAINKDGESIFPEMLPIEFLEQEQRINNFTFQAQYMQSPIALGGNIIKTQWFKTYSILPKLKRVYITCDTALKTKECNDYSVFQLWGKTTLSQDSDYYLIDMIRGKWEAPELLQMVQSALQKWNKYAPTCLYVEDKASGIGLIQQLMRLRVPVKAINPVKDKFTRLSDVLPRIEAGYVYIPEIADWKPDFISECEDFTADMSHKHDDQIDCLSMALGTEINKYAISDWLYN